MMHRSWFHVIHHFAFCTYCFVTKTRVESIAGLLLHCQVLNDNRDGRKWRCRPTNWAKREERGMAPQRAETYYHYLITFNLSPVSDILLPVSLRNMIYERFWTIKVFKTYVFWKSAIFEFVFRDMSWTSCLDWNIASIFKKIEFQLKWKMYPTNWIWIRQSFSLLKSTGMNPRPITSCIFPTERAMIKDVKPFENVRKLIYTSLLRCLRKNLP